MQGEREKARDETEGSGQQQPVGQDSAQNEYGEIGAEQQPTTSGSEPPRSMGTRGTEFGQFGDATGPARQQGQSGTGQADLGSQAGSALSGRSDQQDVGKIGGQIDQPASYGGGVEGDQPNTQDETFILQQGKGSDDLRQRSGATDPSSANATGGIDFAEQGRGVSEEEEDEEGTGRRDVGSGGPGSSV